MEMPLGQSVSGVLNAGKELELEVKIEGRLYLASDLDEITCRV